MHTEQQAPPIIPEAPISVTDALISDLQRRRDMGRQKYGVELQTNNGRDALVDLYQEMIDGTLYLKQRLIEMGVQENDLDIRSLGCSDSENILVALNGFCAHVGLPQKEIRTNFTRTNVPMQEFVALRDRFLRITEHFHESFGQKPR